MTSLPARLLAALVATAVGVAVVALGVAGVLQARGVDVPLLADATTTAAPTAQPGPSEPPSSTPTAQPSVEPSDEASGRHRRHHHRHGHPHRHRQEPLAGKVVVIDPGHQLGNAAHPSEINRPVDAGGFTKACNTTGRAPTRATRRRPSPGRSRCGCGSGWGTSARRC